PWLRVHVRAGGTIESIAPRSMTIPGTLAEWRSWTGLPFDTTGSIHVPQGVCPVNGVTVC
ncbi:MAG TPA: N-acetyltransferase, partial [Pseudonocardiaceae bacterium]